MTTKAEILTAMRVALEDYGAKHEGKQFSFNSILRALDPVAGQLVVALIKAEGPGKVTVIDEERPTAYKCLDEMLKSDQALYEKILDTPVFAYWFNQLANLARETSR